MKRLPIISLLSILFLLSNLIQCITASSSSSMKMELIHRHAPHLHKTPKTQLELIKDLIHNDIIRHNMISHKRGLTRRETLETLSGIQPLQAGRDYGTGEYFAEIKIGTPSQKFKVIVDTGSELTWMNCRYRCGFNCTQKRKRIDGRRVFKADLSSSFKTVPCLSDMCKIELMNLFSLTTCPSPSNPCAYDYRYVDGSTALGIFANETVTFGLTNGRKMRIPDVLIGCSDSFQGQSFVNSDGVMGLAFSKHSFAKRVTERFGGKFSYCLVDHLSHKNVSNYLIFGADNKVMDSSLGNTRYTKLELGLIGPFYAVNVIGISIGGVMLKIPVEVWDARTGGGTIVDSGTSLTVLTEPAYTPVMAALQMAVSKYERLKPSGLPMEYCFNSTGFDEMFVPRLVFHFIDGARFEPHLKSYVIDVADGVKCLGFVSVKMPGVSSIGNIMQQNHLWEFDLVKNRVGFAPSTCT